MLLPALPPMPRRRRGSVVVRSTRVPDAILAGRIEWPQSSGRIEWGAIEVGRWAGGRQRDSVGVCARCHSVRRAVDLKLVMRPFGKGEWNVCEGGCA